MPALMVQGCSSWAGKSLLTAALCRWLARQGVRVVPFKAQNMSNNARVVDGGEIGVAQWLQARAAGVEADVRMNPVLVKPEADGSQVVRLGQVDHELSAQPWRGRSKQVWPTIEKALAELTASYEVVVIEGAGSPAEINLVPDDVVNMRVAEHVSAPVLLVVDIDRGGAFAHLYGTWALLPEEHRRLVAGFVLNRFRGDPALLPPGPEQLEEWTGVPTVGVMPMLRHDLPDEDGAALHAPVRGGRPPAAIVRYPTASNLDEFTLLEQVVDVRWATEPWHLDGAPTVILPGSKHVASDLAWLREQGMARAVHNAVSAGARVIGVCGGLQMLGGRIEDPYGLEDPDGVAGASSGLGLLPLTTTFERDKLVRSRELRLPATLAGPWHRLAGLAVRGYEIRHGRTTLDRPVDTADLDTLVVADGNVLGWYLHGVLEDPAVLRALFGAQPERTLDDTFDTLADAVDEHLDTDLLFRLAGLR